MNLQSEGGPEAALADTHSDDSSRQERALQGGLARIRLDREAKIWNIESGTWALRLNAPSLGSVASARATDLLLASLGYCMADLIVAYCRKKDIPLEGLEMDLADRLSDTPIRIDSIGIELKLLGVISEGEVASIKKLVRRYCKISNTLAHGTDINLVFELPSLKSASESALFQQKETSKAGDGNEIHCAC